MGSLSNNAVPLPTIDAGLASQVQDCVKTTLQGIIKANLSTQFGRTSDTLAGLRQALEGADLDNPNACFRAFAAARVPLTEYDAYAPYIAKFTQTPPARVTDVTDLLAPGLPPTLGLSSSTSGKAPKLIPMYGHAKLPAVLLGMMGRPDGKMCNPIFAGYMRFAELREDDNGGRIRRIPIAAATGSLARRTRGFTDFERDQERLAEPVPGVTAPFGTGLIVNYRSLLLTHAAFALAERSVDALSLTWSTAVVDFMRWIDEEWETLVEGIASGKLPRFSETEEVYAAIATRFNADPQRAEELRKLGPPSRTKVGWAKKVWPKLETLHAICTGTFESVLPQVKAFIGPEVTIAPSGYGCTECLLGYPFGNEIPSIFKVSTDNYTEWLEVLDDGGDGEIKQLWEVENGRAYEPVITTYDGLWRYRIQDVLQVVGFDPTDGTPVMRYKERRNLSIRLPHALVTSAHLTASIAQIEALRHAEFTTWLDERAVPPTIGFFAEASKTNAPLASSDRDVIHAALIEANDNYAIGAKKSSSVRPTIRLLAPGTFADFRLWRGSANRSGSSQIKVPVVTVDPRSQEFFLSKVVDEVN